MRKEEKCISGAKPSGSQAILLIAMFSHKLKSLSRVVRTVTITLMVTVTVAVNQKK